MSTKPIKLLYWSVFIFSKEMHLSSLQPEQCLDVLLELEFSLGFGQICAFTILLRF
jgi:hypothetical protein